MLQDIRYGVRTLLKSPGFTLTAVLTLALGIGANTAMFSVVKAVLLARLPYGQPDRIVQLWESSKSWGHIQVSGPNFRDWKEQNHSMAAMAAAEEGIVSLSGGAPHPIMPLRILASPVSLDFFRVFGVSPELGRVPRADEHRPGAESVLAISHKLWSHAFNGDPQALGRMVRVNGTVATIVGVMPPGFDVEGAEAWFPVEVIPDHSTRSAHNYHVYGRLKEGVSMRAAQADMNVVAARLAHDYADDKDRGSAVIPLYDQIVGPVRPALLILLGAVAFVLLIACANIANLQMARGSTRVREMALRAALGAARGRLIRQLLVESVLLSVAGGIAGFLAALWATEILRVSIPQNVPRVEGIHVDGAVLAFTLILSVAAGILFGILPSLAGSQSDVNEALKEGSGKSTPGIRSRLAANGFVMAEIAVAMVLLIGAGLLIESFRNLEHVDPGFSTEGVLTAEISWPVDARQDAGASEVARLNSSMLARIAAIPGIAFAGAGSLPPINDQGAPDGGFEISGRPLPADPHQVPDADYRVVTRQYFQALGIPLKRGRYFNASEERVDIPQTAIVNESFTKEFFPHQDAIGQHIRFLGFDEKPQFMEIVGVAGDVRSTALARRPESEVFVDGFQHLGELSFLTLVVRGPESASEPIRKVIRSLNADVPVSFQPIDRVLADSVSRQRFQMTLLSIFAGLALLLSAIGIYGVQSYTVGRRASEFGIRVALGASRANVLRLILREGLLITLAGLTAGLAGALLLTRTLSSFLYEISPTDPMTITVIALVLAAVAMLACFLPARRAANTDPINALRYE